ncbi:MAG: hypothetical protein JJU36_09320 [Phycisphaeraceae bacterium]|nr:hypothetical protein [Phycisphaeraceae bacterium]
MNRKFPAAFHVCAFVCLILAVDVATASDTIRLRDGRAFEGRLISRDAREVIFEIRSGGMVARRTFPLHEVEEVVVSRSQTPTQAPTPIPQDSPPSDDAPAPEPTSEEPDDSPRYLVVPMEGTIGVELTRSFMESAFALARRDNVGTVVIELTSPGGMAGELFEMLDLLERINQQEDHPKVVILVKRHAVSAAAVLALSAKHTFMMEGSTLGAAPSTPDGHAMTDFPMPERLASGYRNRVRSALVAAGREPLIGEAIVDPRVELWRSGSAGGGQTWHPAKPEADLDADAPGPERIVEPGQPLTLTADRAREFRAVDGVITGYEELGKALGHERWRDAGDAGRSLAQRHQQTIRQAGRQFDVMVRDFTRAYEALNRIEPDDFSGAQRALGLLRTIVVRLENMAERHPHLAARIQEEFPDPPGEIRESIDRTLDNIRDFQREMRRR